MTACSMLKYAIVIAVLVSGALFPASAPNARTFSLEYNVLVKDIPAGTRQLDFWMPVPHDDPYQQITHLEVESANAYQVATDAPGNRILHLRVEHPDANTLAVTLRFTATRREHRQDVLRASSRHVEASADETAPALKPDRLVPLDNQIRSWAREVVDKAHVKTDLEMARAIYNHIVATVNYDKSGKGWGRGDIYYACENRRGNCTDFRAIFIGYARARHPGAVRHRLSAARRPGIGPDRGISLLGGILRQGHRMGTGGCIRSGQGSLTPGVFLWRA
jgi:transglutaminase-like putative cysteine protease